MEKRSISVYPCPDDHASTPMYLDDGQLRFRCCAGPAGKCKIDEIAYLSRYIRRVCNENDRLRRENIRLSHENAWSEVSTSFPQGDLSFAVSKAEDLVGFDRQEVPSPPTSLFPQVIHHHHHTTNNVTYNLIGDSIVDRLRVDFLKFGLDGGNVPSIIRECLRGDLDNPKSAELYAITDDLEFERMIVNKLTPGIDELPIEQQEIARKRWQKVEEIVRRAEAVRQNQLSQG